MHRERRWFAVAVFLSCAACGGRGEETEVATFEDQLAVPALEPAAAPAASTQARLTERDLDAYQRGMEAEVAAVRDAEELLRRARTREDSLNATLAATEMKTTEVGAHAVGMLVERYREVRGAVEEVLRARTSSGFVDQQSASLDTSAVPPEHRARIREQVQAQVRQRAAAEVAAYARLSPTLVETFRARAPQLDSLRLRLAGERVRVARGL
jgi:hypothetical protein